MIQLTTPESVVEAAPGDVLRCRLLIRNDGATGATLAVRVVGLDPAHENGAAPQTAPALIVNVPAGTEAPCDVPVNVPAMLGIGRHAAAFEVTSERAEDRPMLAPFTLAISSVVRVEMTALPSTLRSRRRAKFALDITNHEPDKVAFSLAGEAPGVRVRFADDLITLEPGERTYTRAKVKGPRHWAGEPTQHNVTVTARGRASATAMSIPFVQRPLFAYRLRTVLAFATVIALFAGAAFVARDWLLNRPDVETGSSQTASTAAVDADGDGLIDPLLDENGDPIPGTGGGVAGIGSGLDTDGDGFFDPLLDENGDPIPGTGGAAVGTGTGEDADGDGLLDPLLDENGNPIPGTGGAPVDGTVPGGTGGTGGTGSTPGVDSSGTPTALRAPTSTVFRGTVSAEGSDSIDDILIRLAPIALGSQPTPSNTTAGRAPNTGGKIWSARHGLAPRSLNPIRQSEPLAPRDVQPDAAGVWLFADVPLRQSYEIVFTKPGFDTQSFVLTPPDDGSPVELDVELLPAIGRLGGAVTGPGGGGLGGVALEVSDGTLVFSTTSATDTDVGSWNLEGVSTPGVYTITASRRGYGTEVVQVRLDEGQQLDNVNIAMTRDVGAIGGQLTDSNGNPLGGVTITASNGTITRTTTSLTEGVIGSFNLPQLTIPGDYTVTAELDGYLSQSRRVDLNGSVGNVNFAMVRTTLQLSGMVTSLGTGAGIVGAGVSLTNDDLTFRVSTAAAPDAGSFAIDDLPPGSYVITIEHFEHVTISQFVTIQAGVQPPPIIVALEPTNGVPDIGRGTLVVEVVDEQAENADDREIKGATITLTRTLTGVVQTFTSDTFSFTINDLELGTYTLQVSAPSYNTSAPRQVSIGLPVRRITVPLIKLGAARGTVVDALNNAIALSGYQVTLTQIRDNGERVPLADRIPSEGTAWATQPDQLEIGTWEATILDEFAPSGYTVLNNQILDPTAGGLMRFVIPADAVDPVDVPPIFAVPYPNIGGRIVTPVLGATGTTTFTPIDSDSLTIAVDCPGAVGGTFTSALLTDELGNTNATDTLFDTFFIDKRFTDGSKLIGNCTITANADGYQPSTVPVNNIAISDGINNTDRFINIALTREVGNLGGSAFWIDTRGPARVPLIGIPITVSSAIVDFEAADNGAQGEQPPLIITAPLSTTTTGPDGTWAFPELDTPTNQVFGISQYDFDAFGFGDTTFDLPIDENGKSITGTQGTNVDQSLGFERLAIEATPPNATAISGVIDIITTDTANRDFTQVNPTVTGPPLSPTALTGPTSTSGAFSVPNAIPGTWTVDFTAPPNHEFRAPDTRQALAFPDVPLAGFDTTLVERGLTEITLIEIDSSGNDVGPINSGATVRAVSTTGGITAPPATVYGARTGADANVYSQAELLVAPGNPLVTPVGYRFEVVIPGFDATSAVAVDLANGGAPFGLSPSNGEFVSLPATAFLAGTKQRIQIRVQRFGSLVGTVLGANDPARTDTVPLDRPVPDAQVVTAVRLFDVTGAPVTNTIIPVDVGPTNGVFSISGAPGYYSLTFEHPDYLSPPSVFPFGSTRDPAFPPTPVRPITVPPSLFVLENNATHTINDPFILDVRKGTLQLSAVTELGGAAVGSATYSLIPPTGSTLPRLDGIVGPTGAVDISNIFPGTYQLEVRSWDDPVTRTGENAFPTIVNVTIQSITAANPNPNTVEAPLPPLAAQIVGTVRAVNTNLRTVALPLPLNVTGDFAEPEIRVDGTLIPNPQPNTTAAIALAGGAALLEPTYTYTFLQPPVGVHTLSMPAVTGLGTPNPTSGTVSVVAVGPNTGPSFEYNVPDTSVRIQLDPTTDTYDSAGMTATLTGPSGATYNSFTFDDTTKILTFSTVAPEDGNFTFEYNDALHTNTAAGGLAATDVQVPFDLDGDPTNNTPYVFATNGDIGRLTGSVRENVGGTGTSPFTFGTPPTGEIRLTRVSSGAVITIQSGGAGTLNPDGTFVIDLQPGAYNVQVVKDGFLPSPVENVTVVGGATRAVPELTIVEVGGLIIDIPNIDDMANPVVQFVSTDPLVGTVAGVRTTGDTVFSAPVPAGTYRIDVFGDSYPTVALVSAANVQVGVEADQGTMSLPRQLVVTVSTVASTATVAVRPTPSDPNVPNVQQQQGAALPYVFRSDDATEPLPATSAYSVQIRAAGQTTLDLPVVPVYVPESGSGLGVLLSGTLDTNPVVNAFGPLEFVGGAPITELPAGATFIARARDDATVFIDGTLTTANGATTYRVNGLSTRDGGGARTWEFEFDVPGVGTLVNKSLLVNSASVPGGAATLTVTPRSVDVTFNISRADGGAVTGSQVTVAGNTTPVPAPGTTVTIALLENLSGSDLDWTVSGVADHANASGTLGTLRDADAAALPTVAAQTVIVPPLTSTRIAGIASIGGVPTEDATIRLCTTAFVGTPPTATCTPNTIDQSDADGTFSFTEQAPGTYQLYASKTVTAGVAPAPVVTTTSTWNDTVTVAASGVPTPPQLNAALTTADTSTQVSGSVTNALGGADVRLCTTPLTGTPATCPAIATIQSAADGSFSFPNLDPGSYQAYATTTSTTGTTPAPVITTTSTWQTTFTIAANGTPTPAQLSATPTTIVATQVGGVANIAGTPTAGVDIRLCTTPYTGTAPADPETCSPSTTVQSAATTGAFALPDLAPGNYQVTASTSITSGSPAITTDYEWSGTFTIATNGSAPQLDVALLAVP